MSRHAADSVVMNEEEIRTSATMELEDSIRKNYTVGIKWVGQSFLTLKLRKSKGSDVVITPNLYLAYCFVIYIRFITPVSLENPD